MVVYGVVKRQAPIARDDAANRGPHYFPERLRLYIKTRMSKTVAFRCAQYTLYVCSTSHSVLSYS